MSEMINFSARNSHYSGSYYRPPRSNRMSRSLFILALFLQFPLTILAEKPVKKPATTAPQPDKPKVSVPEDLLDDEHVQEEFGVSELTTPSIKKVFEDLETLGTLPYDTLKRPIPKGMSSDRTLVALHLGVLIGDGFLSVQSEKVSDLEDIGRAILKHAKVLGAGSKVAQRTKGILENSALGDWKELKAELASTQREVKHEMVLLRDLEMVHLISLGGWLRGLQIGTSASLEPFSAEKAKVLARHDIAEYFAYVLENLPPALNKLEHITRLRKGLLDIDQIVNLPEGKPLSKAEVEKLGQLATDLVRTIAPVEK